MNKTNIKKSMG